VSVQEGSHTRQPPLHDPGTRARPPVPCEITARISPSQIAHMPDAAMTRPQGHQSALCDADQLVVFAATTVAFRRLAAPFVILLQPGSEPENNSAKQCHCDSGRRPPTIQTRHARFRARLRTVTSRYGKFGLKIISGIMGVALMIPPFSRATFTFPFVVITRRAPDSHSAAPS
jgi:hypothetical protein